ncbi:UDP-glucuronic acid decarboxylase 1 [Culex pipiens pallens]|uniref:UDP-glucuronic acid decarboxylase 1 n=1 Tax=Culex pipiens pallens TaxID=42434 RepID=UPI00195328C4|nr:UDP-glucuronic acid decarboxylase 1 [Culex pipiens pallens]
MVFSRRKMKQLFAFGVAIVLVICLYKSWGNPTGAKLTLGIAAGENELDANPERSRYVVDRDADGEGTVRRRMEVALRRHPPVGEEAGGAEVGSKDGHIDEVHQAKQQILALERKIQELEGRIPRKYPDVTFLNYKNRKRILITGGAGFVGSHLVDYLMMQGHELIVVDNFFTGRKRNVEHWLGHENFELIHHDIVNPLFIEVDEIYHLASPASPPHYMYNPVKTIKTNTLGTINMLGLAKRVGAKVLIASTSEVYGDPDVHPQPETYWGHVNPIGPRACYDEGKRVAETLAYAYAKQENVNVRVARIFNTYGPRMHMNDGRVVSNFIIQALQNQSITMYGSGKQTRSFQYVSDLVDGLVALMASNYTLPVNLGNPVERTIEEFAEIIRDSVGCKSKIVELPAVEDDPQRRKPDIARAKRYLDWEPRVPLKEGLIKTIEYFRKELARSNHSQRNIFVPETTEKK